MSTGQGRNGCGDGGTPSGADPDRSWHEDLEDHTTADAAQRWPGDRVERGTSTPDRSWHESESDPSAPVDERQGQLPVALRSGFRIVELWVNDTGSEAELALVEETATAERWVLKVYNRARRLNPEILDRLVNANREHFVEYHPTLAYGYCETLTAWWELLEYVEHGDLAAFVAARGGGITDADVAHELIVELAGMLGELDRLDVIHRDLKPENIFVRSVEPTVDLVLGDFGLAAVIGADQPVFGSIQGSLMYQAPEAPYRSRALDYWALGMIIIELITGRHPFAGLSGQNIQSQLGSKPIDTTDVRDPRWNRLVRGLLTRNNEQRWGGEQLRAWIAGDDPEVSQGAVEAPIHRGYVFNGRVSETPAVLAANLLQDWTRAVVLLDNDAEEMDEERAELRQWLGDVAEHRQIAELLDAEISPERRVARLFAVTNPDQVPSLFGRDIDTEWLVSLANQVLRNRGVGEQAEILTKFREEGILREFAGLPGGAELALVDDRWQQEHRRLGRALDEAPVPGELQDDEETMALALALRSAAAGSSAAPLRPHALGRFAPSWFVELDDELCQVFLHRAQEEEQANRHAYEERAAEDRYRRLRRFRGLNLTTGVMLIALGATSTALAARGSLPESLRYNTAARWYLDFATEAGLWRIAALVVGSALLVTAARLDRPRGRMESLLVIGSAIAGVVLLPPLAPLLIAVSIVAMAQGREVRAPAAAHRLGAIGLALSSLGALAIVLHRNTDVIRNGLSEPSSDWIIDMIDAWPDWLFVGELAGERYWVVPILIAFVCIGGVVVMASLRLATWIPPAVPAAIGLAGFAAGLALLPAILAALAYPSTGPRWIWLLLIGGIVLLAIAGRPLPGRSTSPLGLLFGTPVWGGLAMAAVIGAGVVPASGWELFEQSPRELATDRLIGVTPGGNLVSLRDGRWTPVAATGFDGAVDVLATSPDSGFVILESGVIARFGDGSGESVTAALQVEPGRLVAASWLPDRSAAMLIDSWGGVHAIDADGMAVAAGWELDTGVFGDRPVAIAVVSTTSGYVLTESGMLVVVGETGSSPPSQRLDITVPNATDLYVGPENELVVVTDDLVLDGAPEPRAEPVEVRGSRPAGTDLLPPP